MVAHFIVAGSCFLAMFVLFLVLGRILNNILNQMMKLEYLVRKELDLQQEVVAIRKLLKEDEDIGEAAGNSVSG